MKKHYVISFFDNHQIQENSSKMKISNKSEQLIIDDIELELEYDNMNESGNEDDFDDNRLNKITVASTLSTSPASVTTLVSTKLMKESNILENLLFIEWLKSNNQMLQLAFNDAFCADFDSSVRSETQYLEDVELYNRFCKLCFLSL
jgi:hypothetical protein